MSSRRQFHLPLVLAVVTLGSCSGGPSVIKPPSINASSAGSKAMEMYDKNGDGKVAGNELEHAPSLKSGIKHLDANGDGGISADEIANRLNKLHESGLGVMMFGLTVLMNGTPLEGATVTFEPEAFLDGAVQTAVATTDEFGTGGPSIPKDQRPTSDTPSGIQYGYYKVRITKEVGGKESIPSRFNTETTLGQEVTPDNSDVANRRVAFKLTSK